MMRNCANCLVSCALKTMTYIGITGDVLTFSIRDLRFERVGISGCLKLPLFALVQKSWKMIAAILNVRKRIN